MQCPEGQGATEYVLLLSENALSNIHFPVASGVFYYPINKQCYKLHLPGLQWYNHTWG